MKKLIMLVALVLAVTSITAFAYASYASPAEIMSGLTGKTTEELTDQRLESGKTYGQVAIDEGVWEEFKDEMLKNKKAFLDEKVKDGTITQEQADDFYNNMVERQEYCDGSGNGEGRGMMGFGNKNTGNGSGRGMMGFGNRNTGNGFEGQGNVQGLGCRAWQ